MKILFLFLFAFVVLAASQSVRAESDNTASHTDLSGWHIDYVPDVLEKFSFRCMCDFKIRSVDLDKFEKYGWSDDLFKRVHQKTDESIYKNLTYFPFLNKQ